MANTVHEVILKYMKLTGNDKQIGYPALREAADLSWFPLFRLTKESICKKWVPVKNGVALFPSSADTILGLYTVDDCDDLRPLYEDNIKSTLPMPIDKCSCTAQDHLDCLCPTITDSEASYIEVVIEGEPYTNKYFTRVLKGGQIIEEKYEWVAAYNADGSFNEAQEIPSQKTLCSMELNSCGCPANTEENVKLLCGCGCFDSCCAPYIRDRYPAFYNEFGYYKKDDPNRRIFVFDSDGKKSKLKYVEVKYQSNGDDMLVPQYSLRAFIAMIDWTKKTYSPVYSGNDQELARRNFNREKNAMLRYLHPINFEAGMQGYPALPAGRRSSISSYPMLNQSSTTTEAVCCSIPEVIRQTIQNTIVNNYTGLRAKVDGLAGSPVAGEFTWQNDSLQGAVGVVFILVNKVPESEGDDFTINTVTGVLTRVNPWIGADGLGFTGDDLIIPLFKNS